MMDNGSGIAWLGEGEMDRPLPHQAKSRERVIDYGEVLQSPREVNVMLDMIRQETGRIDSCLVELASGTSVSLGYKTAYNVPCRGLGRLETV